MEPYGRADGLVRNGIERSLPGLPHRMRHGKVVSALNLTDADGASPAACRLACLFVRLSACRLTTPHCSSVCAPFVSLCAPPAIRYFMKIFRDVAQQQGDRFVLRDFIDSFLNVGMIYPNGAIDSIPKMIILPRHARDKHRETSQKEMRFNRSE